MRATDLDMKIDYLRRRNGRRVVTFATATPIANSVTEAYVMQRYLRPDLLEAAGIEVFDSWAATFGQVVTQVELAPEGGDSFRIKSRFARFRNVPEMLRMWHVFADVKTAADLDLPVPVLAERPGDDRRVPETVTVQPSERTHRLRRRTRRARRTRSATGPSAPMRTTCSRCPATAAARPWTCAWSACRSSPRARSRLPPTGSPPSGGPTATTNIARATGLLTRCAGRCSSCSATWAPPAPAGTSTANSATNSPSAACPAESVRFVHEAKNDTELARLFAACRSGHVAVLVGSTEKMGVGTNVQDRAIALHHLDAPWRPADVAQREGRILRQGNLNKEVQVIRYLTERSFDGYSWQTLERKARFIRDVMSPSLDSRELGDIGDTVLSFSEAKALATNNPLLMDKAEADADLARLIRAERAHHRNQDTLRRTITRLDQHIATQTQLASDIDAAIARRQETRGDAFTMTIGDRTYRKRADAGLHLLHILRREAENQLGSRQRIMRAGELGGFPLTVTVSRALGQVEVAPALDGAPGTELRLTSRSLTETDPVGLITRLENRLAQLETTKAKALAEIDHARSEIDHATASTRQTLPPGRRTRRRPRTLPPHRRTTRSRSRTPTCGGKLRGQGGTTGH